MNTYSFTADLLNKFSQLTPWVQVALGGFICAMTASLGYFTKEIVRAIAERCKRSNA
jgi:hypothetical protein